MFKRFVRVWLIVGLLVLAGGMVAWWVSQQPSSFVGESSGVSVIKIYESPDNIMRFNYPGNLTVSLFVPPEGVIAMKYPVGSVEIPGVFVISRVPYTDISQKNPIYDYESCCSGTRYWYDGAKNAWQAEHFEMQQYDDNGKQLPEKREPLPLATDGACDLQEMFGSKKFYKIVSGDEGVPTEFHYFLLTNKGYAIRFISGYDLQAVTDTQQPSNTDSIRIGSQILASVVLSDGVSEIIPLCM